LKKQATPTDPMIAHINFRFISLNESLHPSTWIESYIGLPNNETYHGFCFPITLTTSSKQQEGQ
jgi:hypothetical protein